MIKYYIKRRSIIRMKPYLSACLIVKNEEDILPRCLNSLKNSGVEEIIVVDTGSEDKTKEIAKKFTDKVYDFRWTNNFAEARNFAATYATGEWVLAIDADECMDPENFKVALEEIKSNNNELSVYAVEIVNFLDEFGENSAVNKMARIYRNDGKSYFDGALHEQIVNDQGTSQLALSQLKLYHYGYLPNVVKKQNKRKRNMDIIKNVLQSEKDKSFSYFNYGQELRALNKTEEALNAFVEAFKNKSNIYNDWVGKCLFYIVESLVELKRNKEALEIIEDAERIFPNAPDFPFWKGEIYLKQKRFDDARDVYSSLLRNSDRYTDVIFYVESKEMLPHVRIGEIYSSEGENHKALEHYVKALNSSRVSVKIITQIILLLSKNHSPKEIYDFVSIRQIIRNDRIRTEVIKLVLNLGLGELAILIINDFEDQEQLIVEALQLKGRMIVGEEKLDFTTESLMYGIQEEVFHVADLCILYEETRDMRIRKVLEHSKYAHVFYYLFSSEKTTKKISQFEFISILEKTVCFYKPDFSERLISFVSTFPKEINAKVADVFYSHGYEEIGMGFYDLAEENHVTKQGYVNVIDWLISRNEVDEARVIILKAIKKFKTDFRFYKYGIELGNNKELVLEAFKYFPDSNWLKNNQ